jgi:hypothetical protein
MARYIKAEKPIDAIQYNADNRDEVIEWLSSHNIEYSFHEIGSAGELIIYIPGPVIVHYSNYIGIDDNKLAYFFDKNSFEANYQRIEE